MSLSTTGAQGLRTRRESIERGVRLFSLAAGACDLVTGLLLMAAPFTVLGLMGVATATGDAGAGSADGGGIYLRYIGAFVAAVGAAYLYPLLLREGASRLPTVLEVTALVRGAVALFVTAAVALGALAAPWLLVAVVDGGLAAFQIWLLGAIAAGGAR